MRSTDPCNSQDSLNISLGPKFSEIVTMHECLSLLVSHLNIPSWTELHKWKKQENFKFSHLAPASTAHRQKKQHDTISHTLDFLSLQ